jgi:hypothetical protein
MSVEKTCQGCREDQPNQSAHMDLGGCLYSEYVSDVEKPVEYRRIILKRIESTCEGCRDHDSNELAHMEPGGCLRGPRYSTDDYDDYVEYNEPVKKSSEKITIQYITYYYDKDSKILYTDKNLNKAICKYDRLTCLLSPL